MSTKIRSANYYKKNCIIPKGFENYYKKDDEIAKEIKKNMQSPFEKSNLYNYILRESNYYNIKNQNENFLLTKYYIYFKNNFEQFLNNETKAILEKVEFENTFYFKISKDLKDFLINTFYFKISKDLKDFLKGMLKIHNTLNQKVKFSVLDNNITIICEDQEIGISSEFYQKADTSNFVEFSLHLDTIKNVIENCSINDLIKIESKDSLICFTNEKIGKESETWTILFNQFDFKIIKNNKIENPKMKKSRNQIVLRKSFELKVLEIPVKNLPKIEKVEKVEIKTEKPKTNTGGFYILVESREVDGKKYNYFTSQKFENRESAKNFLREARNSEKAMAIVVKIASQKESEQKISQTKKDKNIINYKWEII